MLAYLTFSGHFKAQESPLERRVLYQKYGMPIKNALNVLVREKIKLYVKKKERKFNQNTGII